MAPETGGLTLVTESSLPLPEPTKRPKIFASLNTFKSLDTFDHLTHLISCHSESLVVSPSITVARVDR